MPAERAARILALAALLIGCARVPLQLGERPDAALPSTDAGAPTFVVLDLALGSDFACARLSGGEVACWGSDALGQLGIDWALRVVQERCGDHFCSSRPQRNEYLARVLQVDAGDAFACALHGVGEVACWGSDRFGERGDGTGGDGARHPDPSLLPGTSLEIAVGRHHACALDADHSVRCWGLGEHGQLGRMPSERCAVPSGMQAALGVDERTPDVACASIAAPVEGLEGPVDHIVAGDFHTCALRAGEVLCWGRGHLGQLGTGVIAARATPMRVPALSGVREVALGGGSTFAQHGTGEAARWGDASSGVLGLAPSDAQPCGDARCAPQPVSSAWPLRELDLGRGFGCGLDARRGAYCWGLATEGRLGISAAVPEVCRDGDAAAPCAIEPVGVEGLQRDVRAIAVGDAHACALLFASDDDPSASVRCWGRNDTGQLGAGVLGPSRAQPVEVLGTR